MKLEDIKRFTSQNNSEVTCCRIIEQNSEGITFEVDENLKIASEHLDEMTGREIIEYILEKEQIECDRHNWVACSFENDTNIAFIGGKDVLYKSILECYGQHRPLALSPDMIWIVINQTLVKHINENTELFRDQIVSHDGQIDIIVESCEDLLEGNPDWTSILDDFYQKIDANTKNGIAKKLVADFSTTQANERIASVVTLMNGVQSYFKYNVVHFICGIPSITLKGISEDWSRLAKKIEVLKEFGLSEWYEWLKPIVQEFVRAASGHPNRLFWKNIVCQYTPDYISTHNGCIPEDMTVDGWFTALFPHIEEEYNEEDEEPICRMCYEKANATHDMDSEMVRVGFKYVRHYPDGRTETFPMELWSGIVAVEEDLNTFTVTPKIGWFVRQSDEEAESLDRLKAADEYEGITLHIDEVPEILQKLDRIDCLHLEFSGKVSIPNWLFVKPIHKLEIFGEMDEKYELFLKENFKKCKRLNINKYDWE